MTLSAVTDLCQSIAIIMLGFACNFNGRSINTVAQAMRNILALLTEKRTG